MNQTAIRSLGVVLLALGGRSSLAGAQDLVVGSKPFTEACVLGEVLHQWIELRTDLEVEHRQGLGGTLICFDALRAGELDLYPEYTGTGLTAILGEQPSSTDPLRTFLHVQTRSRAEHDVEWLSPFGLNNTYAIAMKEARAEELGLRRLSDLDGRGDELRGAFSIEFLSRPDGYPGLSARYGFQLADARSMEHALAYEALEAGEVDLIDAYFTDAKLVRYGLRVLEDDRDFFPPYHAAPVVRRDALAKHPALAGALEELAYSLSDEGVLDLNQRVDIGGETIESVAGSFVQDLEAKRLGTDPAAAEEWAPIQREPWRAGPLLWLVLEHMGLALLSVLLAALVAIPAGVAAARRPRLQQLLLGGASIIQTVPSLALLAFLIAVPGLGLSVRSAILALFLYALLPLLRNTATGLAEVDPDVVDAARAMGLTEGQLLRRVQLPIATPTILAGVRTATVISIGVATLAAFIGAGGLGERIVEGLYLNDTQLILSGALPAAGLALAADAGLGWVERRLVPEGLRRRAVSRRGA